jgi:hypothetical protein
MHHAPAGCGPWALGGPPIKTPSSQYGEFLWWQTSSYGPQQKSTCVHPDVPTGKITTLLSKQEEEQWPWDDANECPRGKGRIVKTGVPSQIGSKRHSQSSNKISIFLHLTRRFWALVPCLIEAYAIVSLFRAKYISALGKGAVVLLC